MAQCQECGRELKPDAHVCFSCGKPVNDARTLQEIAGEGESGRGILDAARLLAKPVAQQERAFPWWWVTGCAVVLVALGLTVAAIRVRNAKPPPQLGMAGGTLKMAAGLVRGQPSRYFDGLAEYLESSARLTHGTQAQAELHDTVALTRSVADLMRVVERMRGEPTAAQLQDLRRQLEQLRATADAVSRRTTNAETRAKMREMADTCGQLLANWEEFTRPRR